MPKLEDILLKARDTAGTVGEKAGEFWDKTKIKMDIAATEKQLAATYEGIGRLVYESETTGEDIEALKADAFKAVKILEREINSLQNKLYGYAGMVRCADCDTVNDGDATFCKKCGKSL